MYTKSSSSRPWSEWQWHDEYQRYYRYRLNSRGEHEYEWDQRQQASSTATVAGTTNVAASTGARVLSASAPTSSRHHEQTPRETDADAINDITEGIANLANVSPGSYGEHDEEYRVSSKSRDKSRRSKKQHKSGGKGKHREYDDDEDDEYDELEPGPTAAAGPSTSGGYDNTNYVYNNSTRQYEARADRTDTHRGTTYTRPDGHYTTSTHATTASSQAYAAPQAYDEADEDPDLDAAVRESRGYNYRTASPRGESSSTAAAQSAYAPASSSAYAPLDETYDDYEEEGATTPKGRYMTTTEDFGVLDPRYRVEPSSRFAPGEIFKVQWSEPEGSGGRAPSMSGRHEIQDKFGSRFFVGFRRFIVVANDLGHCTCVPILTYGGKACKKSGVKPAKHGIIFQRGHKARLLDREPKLGFTPVRVEMIEGENISKESRVNYSKLVTVEHNIKVFFIGAVMQSDWDVVTDAVNMCWEAKIRHKKKFH